AIVSSTSIWTASNAYGGYDDVVSRDCVFLRRSVSRQHDPPPDCGRLRESFPQPVRVAAVQRIVLADGERGLGLVQPCRRVGVAAARRRIRPPELASRRPLLCRIWLDGPPNPSFSRSDSTSAGQIDPPGGD